MMRTRFALTCLVFAMVAVLASAGRSAPAAAQDEPETTQIVLSSKPALDDRGQPVVGQYRIVATLTTADGRYVAKSSVRFVERLEFFGPRTSALGTAKTNGTGNASIIYQPANSGEHTIFVEFSGNETYAASEAQFVLAAADAVPPFPEESLPLAAVGRWLSISLAILGVAFWAVLLGVVGRAVRTIRVASGAAPSLTPEESL
jgi:hypothetical protein